MYYIEILRQRQVFYMIANDRLPGSGLMRKDHVRLRRMAVRPPCAATLADPVLTRLFRAS